MSKTVLRVVVLLSILGLSCCVLAACGGDTGGDGESYDGTAYNGNNAGDIRVEVNEDRMSVGQTSGFHVYVNNADGAGVSSMQIACDTETGLALIEPTTGYELTDSSGQMSGRVGCVLPGSYQMACRLPVGANKRSYKTIICEGPVPDGFAGFPGAGGGSLGVGDANTGGAVPPAYNGSIRVSDITVNENGADTLSIDVERQICKAEDTNKDGDTTDPGETTLEPFTDTLLKITIKNETAESVNFSGFSYDVSGSSGSGVYFSSSVLAFSSGANVAAGGSQQFTGLFLKANTAGGKSFTGSSASISTSTGFRNVAVTVYGTSASGQSIEASATVGMSFNNYNKCS